ncbi:hypothetical protein [Ekhidna sp.]
MKNLFLAIFLFLGLCTLTLAQEDVNIVAVIDKLTIRWDETAIKLKDYQGVQEFCLTKDYKAETIELLDMIHHWDTSLYFIVKEKFDTNEDKEAAATLKDIEKLESEYSTEKFKLFMQDECNSLKIIQDSFDEETIRKYEKGIKSFEKELVKYVNSITYRIDIIDEHVHHLKFE